jgi:hypothetical protein
MDEHKLIDTGEYLISEVEGLPTCAFSYEFYDKMVTHPKVKEAYELKLYAGKRGGKSLYAKQQLELLKSKEVILIDGMSKSAACWTLANGSRLIFNEMGRTDIYESDKNNLTQSIKEVTLEPSSLLMKLIRRI